MAIKILNRSYSEIYTDGLTDWLLANVGEWQKLKLQCEVGIDYQATQQQPIEIDYINNAFVLSNGRSWGSYGFDTGMIVVFGYKKSVDTNNDGEFNQITTIENAYTISNVYQSTMEVSEGISADDFDNIPVNFGSTKITDVLFYVPNIPEGVEMVYGHIANEDFQNESLNSFIDGSEAKFVLPNINAVPVGQWQFMEPSGFQSGMSIRSLRFRRIDGVADGSGTLYSWNVPNTQITIDPVGIGAGGELNDIGITTFQLNGSPTVTDYQSVGSSQAVPITGSGTPGSVNSSYCLIDQASEAYTQDILFDFSFKVVDTQELSNIDQVSVVLLRYSGAGYTFAEKIYIQTLADARGLLGKELSVNALTRLSINEDDSYVLGFEYLSDFKEWNVDVELLGGVISASNKNTQFPSIGKNYCEFEIEYMISSFFENLSTFENGELPSFLLGDGSLTDNYKITFFPEWNNPNVYIKNDLQETARLGNTGWFDENYNERPNDFNIDSVEYFDENGNFVDGIDYVKETKVKIVVSGVPNLGANTECGFGFAWIPSSEEDFKELETPFYQNCFVHSGSTSDGFVLDQLYTDDFLGAGLNGGSMDTTQIKFTKSSDKIIFEATFKPNAVFTNIFGAKQESDRNYILYISVADGNLERNFSDRVALLADFNVLVKSIPPAGEYDEIDNAFIPHPYEADNIGFTTLQGIIQDDILCRLPFKIPTNGSKIFQSMAFGVEVLELGSGRSFELERVETDLTQYPITSDGVQQIDLQTIRGFKLEPGNNKNWFRIAREPSLDTSSQAGYIAYFATKMRWEDWLLNSDAPDDFYNADELNDGFHNDWINYLRTSGWELRFFTEILSEESGDLYEYKNRWNMTLDDYDENSNISVTHQYFRDSDDTLLNVGTDPETLRPLGVILNNEKTRIEIEFELLDDKVWNLATTYGVITLEIDKGVGRFEQRQLSTVWGSESDNPLIPLENETHLKKEVDGTNKFLKLSCLVDPELLDGAIRYRITGRVGCSDNDGVFSAGLYEFRYENVYE